MAPYRGTSDTSTCFVSVPAKRKGEKKDDETKGETKMPKKEEKQKEERIKSYEYKKWDNFDVDAELKKIEEDSKKGEKSEAVEAVDEAVLLQGPNSIEMFSWKRSLINDNQALNFVLDTLLKIS